MNWKWNRKDVLQKGIHARVMRLTKLGGWWNIEKAGRCHQWGCEIRSGR